MKSNLVKLDLNSEYLKKQGVTNQAIAAILGNWSVESSINPKRAEGDYLNPPVGATESSWDDEGWLLLGGPSIYNGRYPNILKRGLGLGQWTDTADGSRRHTLLLEYAKSKHQKWYDFGLQLDFMLHGDNPYYTNWLKDFFKNSGSPASLTQLFLIYWEGNSGDKLLEGQTRATEWYYQIEKGFSQVIQKHLKPSEVTFMRILYLVVVMAWVMLMVNVPGELPLGLTN